MVVTAGWSDGDISSAFPPGIPIGEVTDSDARASRRHTSGSTCAPFADLRDMEFVQVRWRARATRECGK